MLSGIADDLEWRVRGTGGLQELSIGTFLVSVRTLLGQDATATRDMVAEAAAVAGSFGEQFVACCDARLALVRGDHEAVLRLADRALELGVEHRLELSMLAASRLRTEALVAASNSAEAIEAVVDSIDNYSEHGRWIGVLLDAPYAARLLYQHGRVAAAARTLSVLANAELPAEWSAGLAEPLAQEIIANHPDRAGLLEPQPPTSYVAFAAFLRSELGAIEGR